MASVNDINRAFQLSGIGRGPTDDEIALYTSNPFFADAGKVEGDIRAGGGGRTAGGGSSGGGAIKSTDFQKLEEQAFAASKPYYLQLAKESRGDFNRAVQVLNEDYLRGTRQAKEEFARKSKQETDDLNKALEKFGITFKGEQEDIINNLNKRGMAVGQMGPEGEFNVLKPTTFTAKGDVANINTPANVNLGFGATELNKLQQDQKLRQEAIQRASNKNLEQYGIDLSKYTNAPSGDLAASGIDRSKLGKAELEKLRGTEDLTRQQQVSEQGLFEKRRQEALNVASMAANTSDKAIGTGLNNRYLQNQSTDWVERGI